ncbi:MAG: hypothetical protein WA208_08005 [Thermoanaerobaculia bacterium]
MSTNFIDQHLTDDEKRQILYAVLLRHFPETQPLRERAVDCLVLGALFGTTADSALKLGDIQRNLRVGDTTTSLRLETIKPAVDRLVADGKVRVATRRFKKVYFLGDETQQLLATEFQSSRQMFSGVVARMCTGVDVKRRDDAERLCRRFMSECFAKFGRQVAKTVTGDITAEELMARIDPSVAFTAAAKGCACTEADLSLLYARCIGFLKSTDHQDQRLKLYLTRAFYFASLLEFDDRAARDLSRAEFSHSVIYLDTNIIIPTLLGRREWISTFSEVLNIARRLSIEVRVSGATINEARRVAAARTEDLTKVVETLPEQVIETSRDSFLAAFVEHRDDAPSFTVEELLAPFDNIRRLLADEYRVNVDESAEVDFDLGAPHLDRLRKVIGGTADELRKWPKSPAAVDHDIVEYLIVQREIEADRRAFVLTHDRSLIEAGLRYRETGAPPVYLSFMGFLQSIAPYVTASEELSFVEAFSTLLVDQLPPIESAFDIHELRLLADVYDDVQQTPPEQLIEAYQFVKTEMARKGSAKPLAANQVVLGLRKFLSSSADEKERALTAQIQSLTTSLSSKEAGLQELGSDVARIEAESKQKDVAISALLARVKSLEAGVEAQKQGAREEADRGLLREKKARRWQFLAGAAVAVVIGLLAGPLATGLVNDGVLPPGSALHARVLINLIGAALFLVGAVRLFAFPFVTSERRRGFLLVCVMIATYLGLRELQIGEKFERLEPTLNAITLIAAIALWVFAERPNSAGDSNGV